MEYLGDSKPVNLKVPLVSVCVATFQHFKFIEKCLQSILQQKTSFDYEILIGEDVSTDGTRELCIHYAEKHPDLIRLFLRDGEEKKSRKGKWIGKFNHLGLYRAAKGKPADLALRDHVPGDRGFRNAVKRQWLYRWTLVQRQQLCPCDQVI